ncbi:glycosyltransferase [Bradyrhizobium sp. CB82]|uniref:glycosyltransferase n=1 Tax=Bradyrhizobium sp. CB82 TaxID=3039159 RepID=UPI0024B14FDE|nr:glycosyltransferase [Bradyrhizobium sp. CB82]WFU44976.1 glycosyltransferase [Bradyrhizobium sp. CB82]
MARSASFVSIIIPAKNAVAYIRETIDSALAQSADVGEVIVIDDGSSDDTAAIVRSIGDSRVHLITNERAGVSAARNLGAQTARGTWLLFLDADDRLRSGAVATLVAAAKAAPDAALVYGDYDLIDGDGRPIGRRGLLQGRKKPSGNVLARLARGNFIVNGGIMLVRTVAFRAAGGFDERLSLCEDWHCWCRLAATGEFQFVPVLLLDYRVHTANTMNAAARSPRDFFPAVERVFADELILGKLAPESRPGLRRAAEIHLITYAATQAVRFGHYGDALRYMRMVGQRSLAALPRSFAKLVLARLGI